MQKRGISPIISTILIISLTIIIAVIVMTWGFSTYKNYKDKTQEESEVALLCSKTGFNIKEACVIADNVHVVLENTGSESITGFLYRVKSNDGISIYESGSSLDVYSRKQLYDANFSVNDVVSPKSVEIFPKINYEGKDYICSFSQEHNVENCFNILNLGIDNLAGYDISPEINNQKTAIINIVDGGDLNTLETELQNIMPDFKFQNELSVPSRVLGSAGIQEGYVISPEFTIPNNEKVTHLGIYGETNGLVQVYLIDSTTKVKTLPIYPILSTSGEGTQINFEYRLDITNLRDQKVQLKIDYGSVNIPTYFILYRFCYTDYNSGCTDIQQPTITT